MQMSSFLSSEWQGFSFLQNKRSVKILHYDWSYHLKPTLRRPKLFAGIEYGFLVS